MSEFLFLKSIQLKVIYHFVVAGFRFLEINIGTNGKSVRFWSF